MRIIFMGAGALACPALRNLLEQKRDEVVAVVTQPDRPGGRRLHLKACPVRSFMEAHSGIPVLVSENASTPDMVARLRELKPDLMIVADFGQFLKRVVLEIPPRGMINIHPSLLPKYRGAAPIQWAIANGDLETGVSILYVTERMDAGDLILQERAPIRDEATTATLEPLLAELGATLLMRALDDIRAGRVRAVPQDETKVVLAPKLSKEDGRVDWPMAASAIRNRVRAFQPWPGSFCEVPEGSGHLLKLIEVRIEKRAGEPGMVLECGGDGPLVACGEHSLRLLEVQPEGKKPMAGAAFLCGHKLMPGSRLG